MATHTAPPHTQPMQSVHLTRTAAQAHRTQRACPPWLAALRPLGVALLTWGWLGVAAGTPLLASASTPSPTLASPTTAAPAPAGAAAALPWGSGFERRQAVPTGTAGPHTERMQALPPTSPALPLAAQTPSQASGRGTGQGSGRGSGRSR